MKKEIASKSGKHGGKRGRNISGQSLVEFTLTLPLLLLLVLGIIELSYALYDQHVIVKLAREGSNLISRQTTLYDAATAMTTMATTPVSFSGSNSLLIFSVIHMSTTGNNSGKPVLFQRYSIGNSSLASSILTTKGTGTFGSSPDYYASNPDSDTNLQITNLSSNVVMSSDGYLYLTEVYSKHSLITPFQNFGITLPSVLGAQAYF